MSELLLPLCSENYTCFIYEWLSHKLNNKVLYVNKDFLNKLMTNGEDIGRSGKSSIWKHFALVSPIFNVDF